jgi:hypothetical protein
LIYFDFRSEPHEGCAGNQQRIIKPQDDGRDWHQLISQRGRRTRLFPRCYGGALPPAGQGIENNRRQSEGPAVQVGAAADPDLARVVAAWPALPAHLRQTILTLLAAATPARSGCVRRRRGRTRPVFNPGRPVKPPTTQDAALLVRVRRLLAGGKLYASSRRRGYDEDGAGPEVNRGESHAQ